MSDPPAADTLISEGVTQAQGALGMGQMAANLNAANFAQAAVYTVIIIAILGVLNFLAQRYNKTFDSTANKKYTLSDQTAKIVKNVLARRQWLRRQHALHRVRG
jgi:hypothetical protein